MERAGIKFVVKYLYAMINYITQSNVYYVSDINASAMPLMIALLIFFTLHITTNSVYDNAATDLNA